MPHDVGVFVPSYVALGDLCSEALAASAVVIVVFEVGMSRHRADSCPGRGMLKNPTPTKSYPQKVVKCPSG